VHGCKRTASIVQDASPTVSISRGDRCGDPERRQP
jgi:hypothetical protein